MVPASRTFIGAALAALLLVLAWPRGSHAANWAASADDPPPSRAFHSMIADSVDKRLILFGGFRNEGIPTPLNDLWAFSVVSNTWSQLSPGGTQPPPTWFHAAVYDGSRRRMWVFGGQTSALYALDLPTLKWNLVPTTGDVPPALQGHAMVYDWYDDRLVVFGGNTTNNLYYLSLATLAWTQVPADSTFPPARSFHTLTVERLAHRAILYGGIVGTQTYLADAYELDLPTLRWTPLNLPRAPLEGRAYHLATMDVIGNRVLIEGGRGLRASWRDVRAIDFANAQPFQAQAWDSLVTLGTPPEPDEGLAGAGLLAIFYQYGGRWSLQPGDYSDTWNLNEPTATWSRMDTVPPDRYDAAAFLDPVTSVFYVFGGSHGSTRLDDSWSYDGVLDEWTELATAAQPAARSGAACAVDGAGRHAVLFGGTSPTALLRDTWTFSLDSLTWSPSPVTAAPSKRQFASMDFDPVTRRAWLYGGRGASGPLGDVWYYSPDSATWTQVLPSTPPGTPGVPDPRYLSSLTFDPEYRRLYVYGGMSDTSMFADLWSFSVDSLTWRPLPCVSALPAARAGHSAIIDNDMQLVIYGGASSTNGPALQEVWAYNPGDAAWWQLTDLYGQPAGRWRHTAEWNGNNRYMRVFGGLSDAGPLNDTRLLELPGGAVGVASPRPASPLRLEAPAPNPSAGTSVLAFALPRGERGELCVYDAAGRRVARVWSGSGTGAPERAAWDGRRTDGSRAASGVYFARLSDAAGHSAVRKLVRVR